MTFKKVTVGLFFAIIILFSVVTLLLPKQESSEIENRDLQQAPELSIDTLLNKKFMTQAETYLADHMVFRTAFAASKTQLERLAGKSEINSVFITEDMLLEKVPEPDLDITKANVAAIEGFAKKYSNKFPTSVMLVPTAAEIYKSELPSLSKQFNQTAYIKETYDSLKTAAGVDAFASLSSNADSYIYYRTDHHWTSLGAYIGYSALAKPLGFKASGLDRFEVEHASHEFLGTLYSKVVYGEELADTLDLYHSASGETVTDVVKYTQNNTQTYSSIFFKDFLSVKDKYSVFLGGNEAVMKIKTNVDNDKKLVVFKDSYANAIMQFLPLHYEEILLVDTRYLNQPLESYADLNEYNQALFLYNVSGFVGDASVKKVSLY